MKTNEIDVLIKQALSKEEAEFYDELDEQSMPEMLTGLFQGKMRLLNIMMLAGLLIVFAAAVFCTVQFIGATDPLLAVKWGAGAVFFMMASGLIKIMQFMQMDKNAILREIKRLELQLSMIARKFNQG